MASRRWRAFTDDHGDALTDGEMVECCPRCEHSRDEQADRSELEEAVAQWCRRVILRKPPRAAMCGATARMPHVITPCGCRHPFHGS